MTRKYVNIRVSGDSYAKLRKMAKMDGRTIKGMFDRVVSERLPVMLPVGFGGAADDSADADRRPTLYIAE